MQLGPYGKNDGRLCSPLATWFYSYSRYISFTSRLLFRTVLERRQTQSVIARTFEGATPQQQGNEWPALDKNWGPSRTATLPPRAICGKAICLNNKDDTAVRKFDN